MRSQTQALEWADFDRSPDEQATAQPSLRRVAASDALPLLGSAPGPVEANPFWQAAIDACPSHAIGIRFANPWDEFVAGRLRPHAERILENRVYLVARVDFSSARVSALTLAELETLLPVLCGEQQKAVAVELAIAVSTASGRCQRAFEKLGVGARAVPLPLVIAAQRAAGSIGATGMQCGRFAHHGNTYRVLSVPRPDMGRAPGLAPAERDVAQLLIEGLSATQIARHRGRAVRTVACQLRAVSCTLRAGGRYALIRRAVELGCFGDVRDRRSPSPPPNLVTSGG
jgi:DNA-binding NarL/FixJ family response regulator